MSIAKVFLFLVSCDVIKGAIVHCFKQKKDKLYLVVSKGLDNGKSFKTIREILAEDCRYKNNFKPNIEDIVEMLNYSKIEPEELKVIKGFPDDVLEKIKDEFNKQKER